MSVVASPLSYRDGDAELSGILFRPGEPESGTAGVLLIHGGAGLDSHAKIQARRYAVLGYLVFACDLYGDGVAGDPDRIKQCATAMRDDPPALVRRASAGLAVLQSAAPAGARYAAVGFCFGGMAALALARTGVPLAAVVSVHGTLHTSRPAAPGAVHGRLLICHGSTDPHVPLNQVVDFSEEMDRAGADWRLVLYGGAQHGFTHEHVKPGAIPGVAYDATADQRSFNTIRHFLTETLGR